MNDTTIEHDRNDTDLLVYEISDEALETAARSGKETAANFTLGACTGLTVCPG